MPGKQDGPSRIIYGLSRPPRIAQNANFFTLGPIYEKPVIIFFPCYKFVCSVMRSYCPEIFSSAVPPGSGAFQMPTCPSSSSSSSVSASSAAASTVRGGRANLRNASVTFSLVWHEASLG